MPRALLAFLFTTALLAQTPESEPSPADRAWIASKIYSAIQIYFAHADGAPGFELEREYREYLRQAFAAPDRRAFSLSSIAFLGKLRNGHSGFQDQWLTKNHGQPLGFDLLPMTEGWVVSSSQRPDIEPGDVVVAVDDRPIDRFYSELDPLLEGSSMASRRRTFAWRAHLWPDKFELMLAGGKRVRIDRATQKSGPSRGFPGSTLTPPPGIGYIRIRSFDGPAHEKNALAQLRNLASSRAIVFDVRGNGGGGTPTQLLDAIMNRPWRDFGFVTPLLIGHAGAQNQVRRAFPGVDSDPYYRGYLDAFEEFSSARVLTPGPIHLPSKGAWNGKVIVVTDGFCNSACEDFAGPLKTSGRGAIVGEPTNGSSGQPYIFDFGNGMSFRVSSKRYYLPDGSPFEGVGLSPDVEVKPTLEDLKAGRDPALAKAFQLAAAN